MSAIIDRIDAEMDGRRRGYADVRGELLFECKDEIERLERAIETAAAYFDNHAAGADATLPNGLVSAQLRRHASEMRKAIGKQP